jgi:hypothetical protein
MDTATFWLAYGFMAISTAVAVYAILPPITSSNRFLGQLIFSLITGAVWPVAIVSRIIVRIIDFK